jgi:hypothetical protein
MCWNCLGIALELPWNCLGCVTKIYYLLFAALIFLAYSYHSKWREWSKVAITFYPLFSSRRFFVLLYSTSKTAWEGIDHSLATQLNNGVRCWQLTVGRKVTKVGVLRASLLHR